MKKTMFLHAGLSALIIAFLAIPASAGPVSRKPQLPLQIRIEPVQPGITPDAIHPGDIVEFKVSAATFMEAGDVRITVELAEGAELVAGALQWSGSAAKGEEKQLFFSVRAPKTGAGKIKAGITVYRDGKPAFMRKTQYVLSPDKDRKNKKHAPPMKMKKDTRGGDIVEY